MFNHSLFVLTVIALPKLCFYFIVAVKRSSQSISTVIVQMVKPRKPLNVLFMFGFHHFLFRLLFVSRWSRGLAGLFQKLRAVALALS